MSYPKKDRVFPVKKTQMTEAELAQLVASALRHDYGDLPSAVKQIGLQTDANLRAIRNWYEGRHAPSSMHLLRLAKSSPQILQLVLQQIGGEELADAFSILAGRHESKTKGASVQKSDEVYGEKNCTINNKLSSELSEQLNKRQLWFLEELQSGKTIKTEGICIRWNVSLRTAKSDVARVVALQLVRFVGAKKTGYYALISPDY